MQFVQEKNRHAAETVNPVITGPEYTTSNMRERNDRVSQG